MYRAISLYDKNIFDEKGLMLSASRIPASINQDIPHDVRKSFNAIAASIQDTGCTSDDYHFPFKGRMIRILNAEIQAARGVLVLYELIPASLGTRKLSLAEFIKPCNGSLPTQASLIKIWKLSSYRFGHSGSQVIIKEDAEKWKKIVESIEVLGTKSVYESVAEELQQVSILL